ncbi:MAG TPA: methyltransferase [Nitrospiraceae bacterium]|jgi:precorrin-6B methylase 2|nr:methyltransferase [Nitrospiraceae bacterium]
MRQELSLAELFQLGYYWETKILLTAVKLDLFTALGEKDRSLSEIARQIEADERSLDLLLNALVAMKVLTKDGGRYANTGVARTHLIKTAPQYVGHLLLLQDAEWNNWGRLEETIRTGRAPVRRHVFETDPELGANVLSVLDRIGQQSGPALAKRLDLGEAVTMLDLGGGAGTNAIAFCAVYPRMRAVIFDLPQTLKVAERAVKEAGFESRITLHAGDFNADPLGGPYDVALMSDVLHYQSPEANATLIQKVLAHLVPGGRLVVKDRFLDEAKTGPAWVTAFAVHILVNTEQGRCYTVSEAAKWMEAAGFQSVTELEKTAVVQGIKSR